jgi:hypothetical protein
LFSYTKYKTRKINALKLFAMHLFWASISCTPVCAILCAYRTTTEEAVNNTHFNQRQLADRWSVSERTLERWRWHGCGPRYVKIGNRVLYRIEDIEDYENANTHTRTQLEPQPILAGGAPC